MMAALRKGFLRIPGLSLDMYAKFYSHHAAQAFGHLDLTIQRQRSRRKRNRLKSQGRMTLQTCSIRRILIAKYTFKIHQDCM